MKIKIVDLLNKIANGEEVPEKIMYDRCLYTCDKITRTYYDEENNTLWESYNFRILTDEVEIIEDSKKIEKLKAKYTSQVGKLELANKINELIDEINNLKRE